MAVATLPAPTGFRIPGPPGGMLPALIVIYGAAVAYKYWSQSRPGVGPDEGIASPTPENTFGWTQNWICEEEPDVGQLQWSLNIPGPQGPEVNPPCLSGQSIGPQTVPIGSFVPVGHGVLWWVTDQPLIGSPYKLTAEWTKATPHDGMVPLPAQAGAPGVPSRPAITWVGGGHLPHELVAPARNDPWTPGKLERPISDFPATSVWGPRPRRVGAVSTAAGYGPAVRASGRTAVVTGHKAVFGNVTMSSVRPRIDAHVRTATPPRMKEKKMQVKSGIILQRVLSFGTEFADMVKALHEALDKDCLREHSGMRVGNKLYASEGFVKRQLATSKTPQRQLRDLYNFFDCLDGVDAIKNIIKNEIEDRLIGKGAQKLRMAQKKAQDAGYLHERPGWQTGPWDTATRDNRVYNTRNAVNQELRGVP